MSLPPLPPAITIKPAKRIGLFFGSFNPIHIGHLIIAETVAQQPNINEVWFVISPQNPFKDDYSLLDAYDRLHLVNLAIEDNPKLRASKIEYDLARPNYTIDTLTHLYDKYPNYEFVLIMGDDNLQQLHKWKNYEQILLHYHIIVYPRIGHATSQFDEHPKIQRLAVPLLNISATYIRQALSQNKSVRYLVHDKVWQYIQASGWWKRQQKTKKQKTD